MIVGIYRDTDQIAGDCLGTVSLTRTGKIKVDSRNKDMKKFLKEFSTQAYGLAANGIADPSDPERWITNLPNGHHNIPYYFVMKINECIEEEITDDNEETIEEEDSIEEYNEESDDNIEGGDSEDTGEYPDNNS